MSMSNFANKVSKASGTNSVKFLEAVQWAHNEPLRFEDNKCLELNAKAEQNYLMVHLHSLFHNLELIQQGLKCRQSSGLSSTHNALLDIGTSPLTFVYKKYLKGVSLSTIDLTDLLKDRCHEYDICFRQCNISQSPFPYEGQSFDVCVFTEVMEHLQTGPCNVFPGIHRVLKSNGILIFSVPNTARLSNRIKALMGKPVLGPVYHSFEESGTSEAHKIKQWVHGLGHLREYTMSECLDILNYYGFKPITNKSIAPALSFEWDKGFFNKLSRHVYNFTQDIIPNTKEINLVLAQKQEKS
jgi:2-polyprenyl-3-methyl-5-hydroxy-6-metoxy-1,4-benzoquinol methylase